MTDKLPPMLVAVSTVAVLGAGVMAARADATKIPQPTAAQLEAAGVDKLPLAPAAARVDLVAPKFSHPTRITNPLFPIGELRSAVLSGTVGGKPFHTETTLLPERRAVEWPKGHRIETLVSQYVAYLDGRIEEVALDKYAQGDDGSVWYFGEDLYDYENGVVVGTSGTWLAGRDGPPAMIMPAHPKVGQAFRAENIPGVAFEEVKVKAVGQTVDGPHGPVSGAIVGQELHVDGPPDDKTFAPGYGEFFTGSGGDVEAMALAVPADRLDGRVPAALTSVRTGAEHVFDQVRAKAWAASGSTVQTLASAWATVRAGQLPARIAGEMTRALATLEAAVGRHQRARAGTAAVDVARSALDLELRYRPPAEIDRERFALWARRILVDAAARDRGGVVSDVTTLDWILLRIERTLDPIDRTRVFTQLTELRTKATDGDLRGAAAEAGRLGRTLARR
jgi:hypothetical protein